MPPVVKDALLALGFVVLGLGLLCVVVVLVALSSWERGEEPRIRYLPAGVVARVDGTDITRAELDARVAEAQRSQRIRKGTPGAPAPAWGADELDYANREELERLINGRILEALAAACGAPCAVTAEDVRDEEARIRDTRHGGSQARMEEALAGWGITPARARENTRLRLIGRRVEARATAGVAVTEEDAREYHDVAHPGDFYRPEITFDQIRPTLRRELVVRLRERRRHEALLAFEDSLVDDLRNSVSYSSRRYTIDEYAVEGVDTTP